jgi:prepilin-type N-terminal cleavage/methylation domain-containing protein
MSLHSNSRSRGLGGFSLPELLVVIAIIGSICAIAIPNFTRIIRQGRVDAVGRQVQMTLLAARLQAVRRGGNVGVVVSTDSSVPATYLIPTTFVDANSNGVLDGGETVISAGPLPPGNTRLKFSVDAANAVNPSPAAATFVFQFTPFGSAVTGSGAKAFFVSDAAGNVLQVGIPSELNGKVSMTKLSGGTYVPPPWKWF